MAKGIVVVDGPRSKVATTDSQVEADLGGAKARKELKSTLSV
jgi:hypothetical protein